MQKTYNKLIEGIRKYFKENNFKKAVIGLSGGIDSSLSAVLVAKAIGNDNLFALLMPETGLTAKENLEDAKGICRLLKLKYSISPINNFIRQYKRLNWKQNNIAYINTKSRIRANILYNYANCNNVLVIGTSNKTELMLGYFTKYGDGACDLEIIGDLYKTEVIRLARFLKLPDRIIKKQPTAELFHGQTDEEELGAGYEEIDKILKQIESGKRLKGKLAKKMLKRIKDNEHKRGGVPVVKKLRGK